MSSAGLDWGGLMRTGLKDLGLPPDTFWALTPAEFALMMGRGSGSLPMLSDGLAALMAAYPDHAKGAGNGRI